MVFAEDARRDIDKYCLTKRITYFRKSKKVIDLSRDITEDVFQPFPIMCQLTVNSINTNNDSMGQQTSGDLVGLFRYEYTHDINGGIISPKLVPRKGDKFRFLGEDYSITNCTPSTGEDDGIIGWDFNAAQISNRREYE
jgi:hypothetical protein